MTERGIIFHDWEIRALRDWRKSMFRRVIKPQPGEHIDALHGGELRKRAPYRLENDETGSIVGHGFQDEDRMYKCPYGVPGDRLWVRESISKPFPLDVKARCFTGFYRASEPERKIQWIPSIHMPRWASRFLLEIVSVRVERVQDISEEDAKAEGVEAGEKWKGQAYWGGGSCKFGRTYHVQEGVKCCCNVGMTSAAVCAFRERWNRDNGPGAWNRNDWTWVVEFKEANR